MTPVLNFPISNIVSAISHFVVYEETRTHKNRKGFEVIEHGVYLLILKIYYVNIYFTYYL